MFDFAISQNQRRRPTRRTYVSWILSGLFHFMMLFSLVKYPQLLVGGMYHRYRPVPIFSNVSKPTSDDDSKNWRTVTVLKNRSGMQAPSAATLKKYLRNWNKKEPGIQPVRISWGDVKIARPDLPPMPRVEPTKQKPEISLPANALLSSDSDSSRKKEDSSAGLPVAAQKEPDKGKKENAHQPPQEPAPKIEVSSNNPPSKIPDSINKQPGIVPSTKDAIRVFEDEQKAIRSTDSGFFDTKGFPLGDYTNLIVERIKGKWFIPSNLKNAQGHTTVVFYIDKDGRFMNARIVMSSGSNSLDLAALNAVIESNPFPPLPEGFPGDHVGAKFVFSYNEPQ